MDKAERLLYIKQNLRNPVEVERGCRNFASARNWRSELKRMMPDDWNEPSQCIIHQDDSIDIIRSVQAMNKKQWFDFEKFHPTIARHVKPYKIFRKKKQAELFA